MFVTLVSYRGDSVHLVFDTGNSVTLPVRIEYNTFYKRGREVSAEEFDILSSVSEKYKCEMKAFAYLARCARSEMQLVQYLKKKEFCEDVIRHAVSTMHDKGLLNDEDFARKLAMQIRRRKHAGSRLIKSELMKKGISRKTAEEALRETGLDSDDEDEAYKAALKKSVMIKKKTDQKAKLWLFLRSRGFGDQTISKTVSRALKEGLIDK